MRVRDLPTTQEYLDLLQAVIKDPAYDPEFPWMFDSREATIPKSEFIRDAAEIDTAHPEIFASVRQAIVASKDVSYGSGRQYQMLVAGAELEVEVFRSIEEAKEWLGLPPEWSCDE